MYLYDETELKEYIQANEDNKLVVALAYLDNYEEALESVEDVRRSLLIALIDRKITKYFSNYDGLVRKLEKDKYFLIMRQSSLETLKEQKFHILDEVKTVNIGNEMTVTLSIGMLQLIFRTMSIHVLPLKWHLDVVEIRLLSKTVTALLIMVARPSRWKRLPVSKPVSKHRR